MLEPPRQYDVPIEPAAARCHLRKRHAHLKCDPRLFREDADRTDILDDADDAVEEGADGRRLVVKVMSEVVLTAGMRLIAVRELAPTVCAFPERLTTDRPFHTWNYMGVAALLFLDA